jgi:hypothetical protein
MPTIKDRAIIIADWLERQLTDASLTDGTIWAKLGLTKSTFYRIKPKATAILDERLAKKRSAIDAATSEGVIAAAKKGIKTRHDRVMVLQEQCDKLRDMLKKGEDIGHLVTDGRIKSVRKRMDNNTRGYLLRTLRELQAEISKIEGDYAPEKKEHDFTHPVIVKAEGETLDLEKLPSELLEQIVALGAIKKI